MKVIYPDMAFAGGAMAPMAPMPAMAMTNGMAPNPAPSSQLKEVGRVRTVFPETWLWTNASIGYFQHLLYTCNN